MEENDQQIEHPDDGSFDRYALGLLEGPALVSVQHHLRRCDACLLRLAQSARLFWIVRQVLHEMEHADLSWMEEETVNLSPDSMTKEYVN